MDRGRGTKGPDARCVPEPPHICSGMCGAHRAPPPRDPLAPTTCSLQAAPGARSLPVCPPPRPQPLRFTMPATSRWLWEARRCSLGCFPGGRGAGGQGLGTGTADSQDARSQGQGQSGRCLPSSNVPGHSLHSRLHSDFGDRRARLPYRGTCVSSVLRGPWPPEFHASQGADNPRKGLLPEPKHFVQLRLLVPQLRSGAPHRAPGLGSSVPLKGPDGTLCPCSWVCMTPDLAGASEGHCPPHPRTKGPALQGPPAPAGRASPFSHREPTSPCWGSAVPASLSSCPTRQRDREPQRHPPNGGPLARKRALCPTPVRRVPDRPALGPAWFPESCLCTQSAPCTCVRVHTSACACATCVHTVVCLVQMRAAAYWLHVHVCSLCARVPYTCVHVCAHVCRCVCTCRNKLITTKPH